jgi:hypothetical protein
MDNLLLTKCLRCRGAVAYEKFYGHREKFWGCKCQICGESVNPVIPEYRRLLKEGQDINVPRAMMS